MKLKLFLRNLYYRGYLEYVAYAVILLSGVILGRYL